MKRLRSERGATLVEFALSSTILFLTLFGIFAFGIVLYSYNYVSNVAREASRYAMVRGSACQGLSDCGITSFQLQTYVRNFGYPGINANNLTVTLTPTPLSGSLPGSTISVTVSYTYRLNIPFWPSTGRLLTLSSTSQKVISQ